MMMRDVRYAFRTLRKTPLFTLSAALTLALCIGANTGIYTIVDRVLLRHLPYPHPERLAQVVTRFARGDIGYGQTGAVLEVLREGGRWMEIAATSGGLGSIGVNMIVGSHAEYVKQQRVSAGFFRVLGVAPARGREFSADEDRPNGPAAAILSHALWMKLFTGDPDAIGRSITLRGEPHTVVGVMPEGFTSGAPIDDLYHAPNHSAREHIIPLQRGETATLRQPILIVWSAVAAVLLIGFVNVAGLLMARGVTRAPEIATRVALGGGRAAILRQLLAESALLAAIGGAAGIALGYAGVRVFAPLLQDAFGVAAAGISLDARVLAITAVVALAAGVVFIVAAIAAVVPALRMTRLDPVSALRSL